jgi:MFS transporter, PPP family, 3-phenylpropionic acid transporter
LNKSVLFLRAFLFFYFSSVTLIVSYLPIYFNNKGLSGSEIGWLLAIGPLAAIFVQPFWGYMTDKYKTVKRFILLCLSLLLISSLFMFYGESFFYLMILGAVFFSFMAPLTAMSDSLAQKTAITHKIQFGSIRSWGSLGFATTALLGGQLLNIFGINAIAIIYPISVCLALLIGFKISDVKAEGKPVKLSDTKQLLFNYRFIFFLFLIMFITITHRTSDSYIGLFITELGGSESLIGWGWFIAVGSEALIFATSGLWFKKFHEVTFLIIAGALYTFRWFLFSIADSAMFIISIQFLHGVTFALFYISAFQYVTKLLPKELIGTGHLLFVSIYFSFSGIIGSLAGGSILEASGGATLYYYLGYLSMIGTIGLIIYKLVIDKIDLKANSQSLAKNLL